MYERCMALINSFRQQSACESWQVNLRIAKVDNAGPNSSFYLMVTTVLEQAGFRQSVATSSETHVLFAGTIYSW